MKTHPVDPVALVSGLLFTFAGLAVIADRLWDDVDVAAVTAAGVAIVGLALALLIVARAVTTGDDGRTESGP